MTDREKIKSEIERIMAEEMSLFEEQCQGGFEPSPSSPVVYTRMQMLLKFINSLPEEPASKDLEEAAKEQARSYGYMTEDYEFKENVGAFKTGAQWMKEKLIDKACEWLQKHDSYSKPTELQVMDFRKYMEEEL